MADARNLDELTSSAYRQALEVIASVEPRIAEATRQAVSYTHLTLPTILRV